MFEQIHELVDVAKKVGDMLNVDEDGNVYVVDEHGDETNNIQDFLMGVQSMLNIIQE